MKKAIMLLTLFSLFLWPEKTEGTESQSIGIVNFLTCVTESKYGKHEQEQMENLKNQWTSLIEQTDKELKSLTEKFKDQEYMDGLSPEAESEMKGKYKALSEDMAKYQGQLYQVLQQANYFFLQKMQAFISKASEKVATQKKLGIILNKEAAFYHKTDMDVTTSVVTEMDKNFDQDKKIADNKDKKEEVKK